MSAGPVLVTYMLLFGLAAVAVLTHALRRKPKVVRFEFNTTLDYLVNLEPSGITWVEDAQTGLFIWPAHGYFVPRRFLASARAEDDLLRWADDGGVVVD